MKYKFLVVSVLAISAMLITPVAVKAVDVQSQIQALIQQIATLQAHLKELQSQQQGGGQAWCHTFNKNLRIGDSGPEIDMLATALSEEGLFSTARTYPDFDEYVASAVVQFQEKYASEILAPFNLKRGTGYVGPSTRKKLNALYGCSETSAQPSITVTSPNGGETWQIGSSYDIKWDSVGLNKINIELWDTSTNRSTIIAKDINAVLGKYTWTPGASVVPGDYKITIVSYFTENTGISDSSNNSFKITVATTSYNDLLESAKNQLASISDAIANLIKSMKGQ